MRHAEESTILARIIRHAITSGPARGPGDLCRPVSGLLARDDERDSLRPGKQPHTNRVFCRRGAGNRLFPKKSGFPGSFVVNRPG